MVLSQRYTNLNDALRLFKLQLVESIDFVKRNFYDEGLTPEEIFNLLKKNTVYKKDPKGMELFQSTETFFYNNWHGIPGCGDCDCFTLTALAFLYCNGYKNIGIVLVGRNTRIPVHIYAYLIINQKIFYFDLTNKYFNIVRNYPFKQHIPFIYNG